MPIINNKENLIIKKIKKTMKKGIIIGILIGLIVGFALGVFIAFTFFKSVTSEGKEKATIASIRASMSSAVPAGIICEDARGEVLSGIGGDKICSNKVGNWPSINFCGTNPSDTNWVVANGESGNWNFTLKCKQFVNCNGPQNALCNKDGCNFSGTCQ